MGERVLEGDARRQWFEMFCSGLNELHAFQIHAPAMAWNLQESETKKTLKKQRLGGHQLNRMK